MKNLRKIAEIQLLCLTLKDDTTDKKRTEK